MSLLHTLFAKGNGCCAYCDGGTWLHEVETRQQARARLGRSRRDLDKAEATLDGMIRIGAERKGAQFLSCRFCRSRRKHESFDDHRAAMQRLVAAGEHPVNRRPKKEEAA